MKVSIIIPIYNVSLYLEDCLDSCLRQSYNNLEIICVDDGSTDISGRIVDEYAKKDARFKVIHKPNGGLPSAREAGIKAALGDYIFHLDGDDSIPDNAIRDLVNVAITHNADIVIGDFIGYKTDGTQFYMDSRIKEQMTGAEYLNFIFTEGLFNVWGKLIKKSLYESNDIYIPYNISIGEDFIQMVQLAHYSKKCVPCNNVVYHYNIRPTSMSKDDKDVIGYLTDRFIYAVTFIVANLSAHMDSQTAEQFAEFNKSVVYDYLSSPYSAYDRKKELEILTSYIKNKRPKIRAFRDVVCRLAYYKLSWAKELTKLRKLKNHKKREGV